MVQDGTSGEIVACSECKGNTAIPARNPKGQFIKDPTANKKVFDGYVDILYASLMPVDET